jgi:hypothetical protein
MKLTCFTVLAMPEWARAEPPGAAPPGQNRQSFYGVWETLDCTSSNPDPRPHNSEWWVPWLADTGQGYPPEGWHGTWAAMKTVPGLSPLRSSALPPTLRWIGAGEAPPAAAWS